MTNPRYFPPGGGQSMKGGLERWVPNGVYSLTKPRPVPPSDAELRKEYPGLQWVEVRNRSDDYCSIGECVVFDKPVLDVDYEQDVFFRGRDDVWLDGYPGQEEEQTFLNQWANWGLAIDPIPSNGSGRVAVGGIVLSKLEIVAATDRYVEPDFSAEEYTIGLTSFRGLGRIVWKSAEEVEEGVRYCVVKLGSPGTQIIIAKTQVGGVPAMSGVIPGIADVDVYDFDQNGNLVARTDAQGTQVTVEAVNIATDAVNGERWIQLKEHVSGRLLVDWELCAT